MGRFIARVNIKHFHGQLETEADPGARSFLHRLLIQEEDKLLHDSEALRETEDLIVRATQHVNKQ